MAHINEYTHGYRKWSTGTTSPAGASSTPTPVRAEGSGVSEGAVFPDGSIMPAGTPSRPPEPDPNKLIHPRHNYNIKVGDEVEILQDGLQGANGQYSNTKEHSIGTIVSAPHDDTNVLISFKYLHKHGGYIEEDMCRARPTYYINVKYLKLRRTAEQVAKNDPKLKFPDGSSEEALMRRIHKEVIKIDERLYNTMSKLHTSHRKHERHNVAAAGLLGMDKSKTIRGLIMFRAKNDSGCRMMPGVSMELMSMATVELAKRNLSPCGLLRLTTFSAERTEEMGPVLRQLMDASPHAFMISIGRSGTILAQRRLKGGYRRTIAYGIVKTTKENTKKFAKPMCKMARGDGKVWWGLVGDGYDGPK